MDAYSSDDKTFSLEARYFDHLAFIHWQRHLSTLKKDTLTQWEWKGLYDLYSNLQQNTNTTLLMFAAHLGFSRVIPAILGYFPHTVKIQNTTGTTALMFAAEKGYTSIVESLLPFSEVDARNIEGVTALMLAAQNNHLNTLLALVYRGRVTLDLQDIEGVTALMLAVQNGNAKIVKELLRVQASLVACASDGNTVWTIAARCNQVQILKSLLAILRGQPSLHKMINGPEKALRIAVQMGHEEILRLLIKAEVNIFCTDTNGNTPLMLAVKHRQIKVLYALLNLAKNKMVCASKHPASVALTEQIKQDNLKAYNLAEEADDKEIMAIFESVDNHPLVQKIGVDIDQPPNTYLPSKLKSGNTVKISEAALKDKPESNFKP